MDYQHLSYLVITVYFFIHPINSASFLVGIGPALRDRTAMVLMARTKRMLVWFTLDDAEALALREGFIMARHYVLAKDVAKCDALQVMSCFSWMVLPKWVVPLALRSGSGWGGPSHYFKLSCSKLDWLYFDFSQQSILMKSLLKTSFNCYCFYLVTRRQQQWLNTYWFYLFMWIFHQMNSQDDH